MSKPKIEQGTQSAAGSGAEGWRVVEDRDVIMPGWARRGEVGR